MKRRILTTHSEKEWLDFLNHTNANPYNHPCYMASFENDSKTAFLYIYENQFQQLGITFMLSAIKDTPYFDAESVYGYPGIIFSSSCSQEFINKALSDFKAYCAENLIVAVLLKLNPFDSLDLLRKCIDVEEICPIVIDDCLHNDEPNLSKNILKNIQKARKKNVSIIKNNYTVDYPIFYKLYQETMDRLNADEFYKFDSVFFESMREMNTSLSMHSAYLNEECIASILTIWGRDYGSIFLSCSNEEGRKLGANHLLRLEVMNHARQKGVDYLNMGGGKSNSSLDSLFQYKLGFSSLTMSYSIGKIIVDAEKYKSLSAQWESRVDDIRLQNHKSKFLHYRF